MAVGGIGDGRKLLAAFEMTAEVREDRGPSLTDRTIIFNRRDSAAGFARCCSFLDARGWGVTVPEALASELPPGTRLIVNVQIERG